MKKIISILLSLIVGAVLFAGGTKETVVQSVSTDGSTSIEKVILSLAEVFEEETGIVVTYNPTGSGSGITAVTEGRVDIGLSSRNLKDSEKKTLTETVLALDGIAIIVNKDNVVSNLTLDEITALYKGEISSWAELGGMEAPVVLIGREAGSGTRDGFESVTNTKDACKYSQELTSTGAVISAVAANPNAIGYASLASVSDTTKTLLVNGIVASEATVLSGEYPVQRDFVLATRTGEKLSEAAQKFFDYITSPKASNIIRNAGAVPLK